MLITKKCLHGNVGWVTWRVLCNRIRQDPADLAGAALAANSCAANSLCREQEKRTMRECEVLISLL